MKGEPDLQVVITLIQSEYSGIHCELQENNPVGNYSEISNNEGQGACAKGFSSGRLG